MTFIKSIIGVLVLTKLTSIQKMTLVWGRYCPQREYISKPFIGSSFYRSDKNYKNPLESNNLPIKPSKDPLTGPLKVIANDASQKTSNKSFNLFSKLK